MNDIWQGIAQLPSFGKLKLTLDGTWLGELWLGPPYEGVVFYTRDGSNPDEVARHLLALYGKNMKSVRTNAPKDFAS
jgi:hypothetical protein